MNPTLSRALVDAHQAELERRHTNLRPQTLGRSPSRTRLQNGSSRRRRVLTSLAVSGLLIVGSVAAPVIALADPPSGPSDVTGPPGYCHGVKATITMGAADDVIVGTPLADVIDAGGGHDVVYGLDGNDLICGMNGNDILYGGPGNDRLSGQAGNDGLRGGDGSDRVAGHAGTDRHLGEAGNDLIDTVSGDDGSLDSVFGGAGDDYIRTRDGIANDSGDAGLGVDSCSQDPGDHVISC